MKQIVFGIVALVVLCGCAGITDDDPFAVPQPFRGVARNEAMLGQAIQVPALVVEAPQGLHPVIAEALRDHVVATAREHDIPALAEPTVLAWVLSGQAASVAGGAGGEQTVILWRLTDDKGVERTQFPVTFQGDEASLSEAGADLLAEQTVSALDAALLRPGTQIATAQIESTKPIAWIGAVRGAPGDGNTALARALQAVLPLKGVRVDADKTKAEWRIEGSVKVVHQSAKEDVVTLTWRVLDAKGKEVGTIAQENAVPRGHLAKAWGQIAAFAAEAAAEGIAQLLQQATSQKSA